MRRLSRSNWREDKIKNYIMNNLSKIQIYATEGNGLFYKSYWLTPHGVWKSDTAGDYITDRKEARSVIKSQAMRHVTSSQILDNWRNHSLWESRKFERTLLNSITT